MPDPLPSDLAAALAGCASAIEPLGDPISYFASTSSTNDVAAALIAAGCREGAIVVADAQTAGRGRHGHTWYSPPVGGLYVSVVLAPSRSRIDPARATALVTIAAGVALAEGIHSATGLSPEIKWPNDLFAGQRKLAGILAEGVAAPGRPGTLDAVVLGYGINVGPITYPDDLRDRATSIEAELGRPVDRAAVLAASLTGLARRYRDLLAGRFDAILDAWRAHAPRSRGARVTWHGAAGPQSGTTAGIDDRGALLIRTSAGLERVVAGALIWD